MTLSLICYSNNCIFKKFQKTQKANNYKTKIFQNQLFRHKIKKYIRHENDLLHLV